MSLGLTVVLLVLSACSAKDISTFNQLQELLRARRDVLGASSYECYSNGECIAQYHTEAGLLTYKQEALCARSEEGCGDDLLALAKREQKCKREVSEECSFVLAEKRRRERRDMCVVLRRRFEADCVGKKRAISEECALVMEDMEGCEREVVVEKRAADKTCPDGWSKREDICYKYFAEPQTFNKANTQCGGLQGHLATLERMIAGSPDDRDFFNNLIASSGAVDYIDEVLSKMDDMFEGQNWREVISYYDNWAWIGVKKVDGQWKWQTDKSSDQLNQVKTGHGDWRRKEPSTKSDLPLDNGNCVVYFHYTKDAAESDTQDLDTFGDTGSWWNASCMLELPFVCEVDAS